MDHDQERRDSEKEQEQPSKERNGLAAMAIR
jgi:hypothetical protein